MSEPAEPVVDRVRTSGGPVTANAVAELAFTVDRDHANPWEELRIDVLVTDPAGVERRIPAFWAGGRAWRARYSSPLPGSHSYRVVADSACGLDDLSGVIEVEPYTGGNPLLTHGGIRIADDRRHFAHADGTPFLWLGDTWWIGMTKRFAWPAFQTLARDRAAKGFNVVQIVAGFAPEVVPFSPHMASEGGQPWTDLGAGMLNPDYYEMPDRKIDHLVGLGIVPCIVGAWGFYLRMLGRENALSHWRYLVARYAAYPIVWCLAGEANLSGIWESLARTREEEEPSIVHPTLSHEEILRRLDPGDFGLTVGDRGDADSVRRQRELADEQVRVWEEASVLISRTDPYHRIRTVHQAGADESRGAFSRDSFDADMIFTGHTGLASTGRTMDVLLPAVARRDKPVFNGEMSYEGIFDSSWNEVQTFIFWSHMLNGAAGHTYGTMAICAFSSIEDRLMPLSRVSDHTWEEALTWNGARNVAMGKRILERLPWWEIEPAPELLEDPPGPSNWLRPYAARLADGTIVAYRPSATTLDLGLMGGANELTWDIGLRLRGLPARRYDVTFANPRTGAETAGPSFAGDAVPPAIDPPTMEDWVFILRPS